MEQVWQITILQICKIAFFRWLIPFNTNTDRFVWVVLVIRHMQMSRDVNVSWCPNIGSCQHDSCRCTDVGCGLHIIWRCPYWHVIIIQTRKITPLQWRHNEHDSISNHQRLGCLLSRLFRSKITSKLRVIGLCEGNSPVTGEIPTQRASNAENVSIWWRHHALSLVSKLLCNLCNIWNPVTVITVNKLLLLIIVLYEQSSLHAGRQNSKLFVFLSLYYSTKT